MDIDIGMRWAPEGLDALQEAAEHHTIEVLENANLIAINNKRVTVMVRLSEAGGITV